MPNDKGVVDTWSIEMTSPTFLLRAGWKSSTIKAGEKVSVTVRPFRDGTPGGLFVSVTLPDGKVMTERPPAPPAAPRRRRPTNWSSAVQVQSELGWISTSSSASWRHSRRAA